jgi:ribosome maturation factor RimP
VADNLSRALDAVPQRAREEIEFVKNLADWTRNVGRDVRVTCREKLDGKIQHQGRLAAADENTVTLESSSGTVNIPMGQVALAKLEIKVA